MKKMIVTGILAALMLLYTGNAYKAIENGQADIQDNDFVSSESIEENKSEDNVSVSIYFEIEDSAPADKEQDVVSEDKQTNNNPVDEQPQKITTTIEVQDKAEPTQPPSKAEAPEQEKTQPVPEVSVPQTTPQPTPAPTPEAPKPAEPLPPENTPAPTTPPQENVDVPAFDIDYWISYAKSYRASIGLELDNTATACWDNPISANPGRKGIQADIESRLNRYKNSDGFTAVWIWAEQLSTDNYNIYIGYA